MSKKEFVTLLGVLVAGAAFFCKDLAIARSEWVHFGLVIWLTFCTGWFVASYVIYRCRNWLEGK